ncbi:MAG: DUF4363 family protein [Peptococcaceae bacterium]|nr:DUF4363 family protein [Peptococcaceae bacterium]
MRWIAGLAVVLAGMIAFGLWGTYSVLDNGARDLSREIDHLQTQVVEQNWSRAAQGVKKIEKLWNDRKNLWAILIDHQEIENIEFSLSRIKQYVEGKSQDLARGEIAVLKHTIEHIPEKEFVTLTNIL